MASRLVLNRQPPVSNDSTNPDSSREEQLLLPVNQPQHGQQHIQHLQPQGQVPQQQQDLFHVKLGEAQLELHAYAPTPGVPNTNAVAEKGVRSAMSTIFEVNALAPGIPGKVYSDFACSGLPLAASKTLQGEEVAVIPHGGLTAQVSDGSGELSVSPVGKAEVDQIHADRRDFLGDAKPDDRAAFTDRLRPSPPAIAVPSSPLDDIASQVAQLPKAKWVDLQGLIGCATTHLATRATRASGGNPHCLSISHLGSGSFNHVYRLEFSDGTKLAASVTKDKESKFSPEGRESEIATMKFVRSSGLYPDIPVPEVHAWDTTFKNPAGAPYVLMDVVDGVNVDTSRADPGSPFIRKFDVLPEAPQLAIVRALARFKASLSRPVPFTELGSIVADATRSGFSVGPLMNVNHEAGEEGLGGPYKSIQEMWYALQERRMLHVVQRWCAMVSDNLHEPGDGIPNGLTPRTFSEMFRFLSSLIPHFKIPKPYSTLVLHHPDFALRNILFDEASLASGTPRITGVIDWSGAQVLPLMLTAVLPADLWSNANTPFRPLYKNPPELAYEATWRSVPYDWTSIGDPSLYPDEDNQWGGCEGMDYKPVLTVLIRRFYLRAYFGSCYATHLSEIHGDTDLARTSLFSDATYYLKFHEAICLDLHNWACVEEWVRETYWRLRAEGNGGTPVRTGVGDDVPLVVGPNVYHGRVDKAVRDLRVLPEESDGWGVDISAIFDD